MTLRQIITWPLRQVDRLNPLASGAGYMLRNYPTLWRTSILKIIWYLFIAHLLLWLAGWWVSQSYTSIPTSNEILSFSGVITALAFLIGFGWFVSVWQTPLVNRTLGTILLTWAVYAAFIYGLATTTQAYFAPVSVKVAELYEPRYLKLDTAALSDPLAYVCKEPNAANPGDAVSRLHTGQPNHDALKEMVDALSLVGTSHCKDLRAPRLGSSEPTRVSLTSLLDHIYGYGSYLGEENFFGYFRSVEWFYESNKRQYVQDRVQVVNDAQLDSRLNSVRLAHFTTFKGHHTRYAKSIIQPGTAGVAAIIAMVLLTFELKGRHWLNAILSPLERLREGRGIANGPVSRVNARFIRTRPVVWQLRLPAAVTLMLLVILSGWFGLSLIEWLFDRMEDQLRNHMDMDSDTALIVILVGLVTSLVALVVAVMQVQRRYFQLDLRRPAAGAQFFLALFFPVLAASLVGSLITVMEIGDEATGNGAVWYGAAICAYLAATFSWSQTFLGLRSAILLAAVFAALSGLILFALTISSVSDSEIVVLSYIALFLFLIVVFVGYAGKLVMVKNAAFVVVTTYSALWTNLASMVVIQESTQNFPINYNALTLNLILVVMVIGLLPLFNRLQDIAMAPADV